MGHSDYDYEGVAQQIADGEVVIRPEVFGCITFNLKTGKVVYLAPETAAERAWILKQCNIDFLPTTPFLSAPEVAYWTSTYRCNYRCNGCYVLDRDVSTELPTPTVKRIIADLAANKVFTFACLHPRETVLQYDRDNYSITSRYLDELKENTWIIGSNGKPCKVKRIIVKVSDEKTYEIMINGRRKIRATENHQIPTSRGLLQVKNLKKGDELKINYDIDVDEITEVDLTKVLDHHKIKYRVNEAGKIVKKGVKYRIPTKIKVTPAFARLCGYYTSEGDLRSFSFNRNETEMHEEVVKDFKDIFDVTLKRRETGESGVSLAHSHEFATNLVFNLGMGLGKGSRNKGVGCVWKFSKANIIEYLRGCFNGDGHLRARSRSRKGRIDETISIGYKTASKSLQEGLRFLLEARLGIFCSSSEGMNPERHINGRRLPKTKYFTITIYGKDNSQPLIERLNLMNNYPNFRVIYDKIGTKKFSSQKFLSKKIVIREIKEIEKPKNVIDIVVDNDDRLFTINGNLLVHNCGGGEPFLRADLFEIAQFCRDHGIMPSVVTNGSRMTGHYATRCTVFGQVNVSIDGVGAHYQRVRGVDGFYLADRAVRLLLQHDNRVGVNFVVSELNVHHLPAFLEYVTALRELGNLQEVNLILFKAFGRGEAIPEIVLSKDRINALVSMVDRIKRRDPTTPIRFFECCTNVLAPDFHPLELTGVFPSRSCWAGYASLCIGVQGAVSPCSYTQHFPHGIGNITQTPLVEIWRSPKMMAVRRGHLHGQCETCKASCRGVCQFIPDGLIDCKFHDGSRSASPRDPPQKGEIPL